MSMTAKSSVDSVRREMIADMKIYLPPTKKEQTTITQILSDMDLEIESLENKKAKYQEIKQGMMQELLTGKTRLFWN
jgi:type I restriction enzyme S subunit